MATEVGFGVLFLFFALLALFYFRYRRQICRFPNRGSVIATSYVPEMEGSSSQAGYGQNLQYSTFVDGKPTLESIVHEVNNKVNRFYGSRMSPTVDYKPSHGGHFQESPSPQEKRLCDLRQRNHSPPATDPELLKTTYEDDIESLPSLPPQTRAEVQAIGGVETHFPGLRSESPHPTSSSSSSPVPKPSILKRPTPPTTILSPPGPFSWLQTVQNIIYPAAAHNYKPDLVETKSEGRKKWVRFGEDQIVEIERVPEELRTRPKRDAILLGPAGEV